jgi:hypothetical protein
MNSYLFTFIFLHNFLFQLILNTNFKNTTNYTKNNITTEQNNNTTDLDMLKLSLNIYSNLGDIKETITNNSAKNNNKINAYFFYVLISFSIIVLLVYIIKKKKKKIECCACGRIDHPDLIKDYHTNCQGFICKLCYIKTLDNASTGNYIYCNNHRMYIICLLDKKNKKEKIYDISKFKKKNKEIIEKEKISSQKKNKVVKSNTILKKVDKPTEINNERLLINQIVDLNETNFLKIDFLYLKLKSLQIFKSAKENIVAREKEKLKQRNLAKKLEKRKNYIKNRNIFDSNDVTRELDCNDQIYVQNLNFNSLKSNEYLVITNTDNFEKDIPRSIEKDTTNKDESHLDIPEIPVIPDILEINDNNDSNDTKTKIEKLRKATGIIAEEFIRDSIIRENIDKFRFLKTSESKIFVKKDEIVVEKEKEEIVVEKEKEEIVVEKEKEIKEDVINHDHEHQSCSICLEPNPDCVIPCKNKPFHRLHKFCLHTYLSKRYVNCPICKAGLYSFF